MSSIKKMLIILKRRALFGINRLIFNILNPYQLCDHSDFIVLCVFIILSFFLIIDYRIQSSGYQNIFSNVSLDLRETI